MNYVKRNLATLSLIAFAIGAFTAEIANAVPNGMGETLAQVSLIAMAAGRGIVKAAEALSPYHDSDGSSRE